jgi:hypothetical protein
MLMNTDQYFRGDGAAGVTAPNLENRCSLADHVVRARGKKTAYTSVSLSDAIVARFGLVLYRLDDKSLASKGHVLVTHSELIALLKQEAQSTAKAERIKAIQARRYVERWREGVVDWRFDYSAVDRSKLITWAYQQVQAYFAKA